MKKATLDKRADTVAWSTRYMPQDLLARMRVCSGLMPLAGWSRRPDMVMLHAKLMEEGLKVVEAKLDAACQQRRRKRA